MIPQRFDLAVVAGVRWRLAEPLRWVARVGRTRAEIRATGAGGWEARVGAWHCRRRPFRALGDAMRAVARFAAAVRGDA